MFKQGSGLRKLKSQISIFAAAAAAAGASAATASVLPSGKLEKIFSLKNFSRTAGGGPPAAAVAAAKIEKKVGWRWLEKSLKTNSSLGL